MTTRNEIIVGMTSIEPRLPHLSKIVARIFHQSFQPDRIIVSLDERLREKYQARMEKAFAVYRPLVEIFYTRDVGPCTKLLPVLQRFPQATIVTTDDDILVPQNWLEGLVRAHDSNPGIIVCYLARSMKLKDDGSFRPFAKWNLVKGEMSGASHELQPEGCRGVLYPPGSLSPRVFDYDVMQETSPRADDLWFKAMALLQGTPAKTIKRDFDLDPFLISPAGKISPLWKHNRTMNDVQWQKLDAVFGLGKRMLEHRAKPALRPVSQDA